MYSWVLGHSTTRGRHPNTISERSTAQKVHVDVEYPLWILYHLS